jgi:hypothetical protein
MLGTVMPNHPLREKLMAAERLALRDIVAQSYTFGYLPQSPDDSDAEAVNLAASEADGADEGAVGGVEADEEALEGVEAE